MYFSKVVAAAVILLSASLEASAHAAVSPVLGVSGTPVRSDVQRPNNARPCGKTNIAAAFDTSDTITMNADNTFTATITNFNRLLDGSREIASALVDTTGTGEQFDQKATVVDNGTRAPKELGSEQLTIQMPAACTGGATGDKCLVSFKTASGFGNCVVVQNAASGSASASNSTDTDSSTDTDGTDDTDDSTDTDTATDSTSTDSSSTAVNTSVADAATSVSSVASVAATGSVAAAASATSVAAAAAATGKSAVKAVKSKNIFQRRHAAPPSRMVRRRTGPYRL